MGFLGAQDNAAAPSKPVFEEWVVVVLNGKTCGYGSTITTRIDTPTGPGYLTSHHEEFVSMRGKARMKMSSTSKVVEDADGGVLSFDQVDESGASVESSGVRDGSDMVVSSRGQTERFHLPRLAALGPEAIRRKTLAVPLQAGQSFSFDTFDTDFPQGVTVQSGTIAGRESHDVRGAKRDLWRMTSQVSYLPGMVSTAWVDDQGNDVESATVVPGIGTMHEYTTDRAECMKQPAGVEVYNNSFIRPLQPMPDVRELGQAVYRLTPVELNEKITLWNEGEQRVLSSDPGAYVVEVTAPRFTPADATWQLPHPDTPELHRYLQASAYLEVQSPEVQALARQAVGDEKNPVVAAHKIQQFVRNYITRKDLNIGFGSAEETAKSREGDCTEHAVLCAALGRAVGLPTRCVVGLGYIPPGIKAPAVAPDEDTNIFGFHMWAEAWIGDGQWVPMDAALDGFDVGHIAILKSALEEVNPMVEINAPILEMMKSLKIEVLKTVLASEMPARPALTPPPAPMARAPSPPAERTPLPPVD